MIQYYPLPTIADVATRLHRAKVIIKLDARNGFWHVTLDDKSSFLTTFNTTFGRYCWKRMPFGIKSATEIFQCKMHEVTERLVQVEVDEFVDVGCSITLEEGTCDHENKLIAFLKCCQERRLKLNSEKLTLRQTEVAFIGQGWTEGRSSQSQGSPGDAGTHRQDRHSEVIWDDPVPEQVSTTPVGHDQSP